MSLDVYLHGENPFAGTDADEAIFIRGNGSLRRISREEWDRLFPGKEPYVLKRDEDTDVIFDLNITHNLGLMARQASIYEPLWRPEEVGITHARDLIKPLTEGLVRLRAEPDRWRAFNPANGWGDYEGLVRFVEEYLEAAKAYPDSTVSFWR